MTEAELQRMLANNPAIKIQDTAQAHKSTADPTVFTRPDFDSAAEERFYNKRVYPVLLSGFMVQCELHKSFEIIEAVEHCGKKYKNRVYTPDFILHYSDESTEVVEVKGRKIKKLQRDYPLRRQLFIKIYCIPNHWRFYEVFDDEI